MGARRRELNTGSGNDDNDSRWFQASLGQQKWRTVHRIHNLSCLAHLLCLFLSDEWTKNKWFLGFQEVLGIKRHHHYIHKNANECSLIYHVWPVLGSWIYLPIHPSIFYNKFRHIFSLFFCYHLIYEVFGFTANENAWKGWARQWDVWPRVDLWECG